MLIEHKVTYLFESNFVDNPPEYTFFLSKADWFTDYLRIKLINLLNEKTNLSETTIIAEDTALGTIFFESYKKQIDYEEYLESFSVEDWIDERTVYFENKKIILKELIDEELVVLAVNNDLLGNIQDILSSFYFQKTEDFLISESIHFTKKNCDKFIYLYGDTPHFYYEAPDSMLKVKINSAKGKYKKIKEFSIWKRVIATVVSIFISIPFLSYFADRFGLDSFILELIVIAGIFFLVSFIMLYFDEKKDK